MKYRQRRFKNHQNNLCIRYVLHLLGKGQIVCNIVPYVFRNRQCIYFFITRKNPCEYEGKLIKIPPFEKYLTSVY
jgi:hypothetical protein